MTDVNRLHDLCTGMVVEESESGHDEFYVSMGLSILLQYALGRIPSLGPE